MGGRHIMKKALLIATYREVIDKEKLNEYAKVAGPAMISAGGRILARGLPSEVFEDGLNERTVVIEFPSVEAAKSAYNSEEYQEAVKILDGGAIRDMRVIEAAD